MRDRLSALRLANVMAQQRQVWDGTPNADKIIEDCCHALATALELDRKQRLKFMAQVETGYQDIRDQLSCSTP